MTTQFVFLTLSEKIRQYPANGGVTSLGVCAANEAVSKCAKDFMQARDYKGVLDLDFKYDARDGQYKLLDVNPHTGTTFRLFVDENGTDVVRALYRELTGQPAATAMPVEGRKWLVENGDFISSGSYLRNGTTRFAEWIRPFLSMALRSVLWVFERNESYLRVLALKNSGPLPSRARNSVRLSTEFVSQQQSNRRAGRENIRGRGVICRFQRRTQLRIK